jgi:RNA 2',3'-cyclic 3'-phosphodiesterase
MRIFVALEIPETVRLRIARFSEEVREFAPQARWVQPESLHVTLKFIGERQPPEVDEIARSLAEVRSESFAIDFRGCGFFPTAKAARVFWVGIEENAPLVRLANSVDEACVGAGVACEERAFSPHLTLARAGRSAAPHRMRSDKTNLAFEKLRDRLAAIQTTDFGTMRAREFILYQSKLSPRGADYTAMARFPLAQS